MKKLVLSIFLIFYICNNLLAPSILSYSFVNTNSSITLAWNQSLSPMVIGYNVYQSSDINFTNTIKINAGNNTSILISNLIGGNTYYFNATSYDNQTNESLPSNDITYTDPNVLNILYSNNVVIISFVTLSGNYNLQKSVDLKNWTNIFTTNNTGNNWVSYTDTNFTQIGFYRVKGF